VSVISYSCCGGEVATDSYSVGLSGLFQRARRADRGSLSHGSHYASPSGLRRRTLGAKSVGCHLPIPTTGSIAKRCVGGTHFHTLQPCRGSERFPSMTKNLNPVRARCGSSEACPVYFLTKFCDSTLKDRKDPSGGIDRSARRLSRETQRGYAEGSMAFLALPGTAVLVERIGRFHALEAGRTNEDPVARLVDPDAIEHVSSLLTAITRFDPNSFDRQVNHPAGWDTETAPPRILASQRALSFDLRFSPSRAGKRTR
jgi:hypothetical protein